MSRQLQPQHQARLGSCLRASLEPRAGTDNGRLAAAATRGRGRRGVLLIDDNHDVILMMHYSRSTTGMKCSPPSTRPEGIELAARCLFQDHPVRHRASRRKERLRRCDRRPHEPSLRDVRLIAVSGYGQERSDRQRAQGSRLQYPFHETDRHCDAEDFPRARSGIAPEAAPRMARRSMNRRGAWPRLTISPRDDPLLGDMSQDLVGIGFLVERLLQQLRDPLVAEPCANERAQP